MIEIASLADIPDFESEAEEAEFWSTHSLGEKYLEDHPPIDDGDLDWLPPTRPRTKPVAVHFDEDVIARLKSLAAKKHKGYQTMLEEFVVERLYEEERREGIVER